MAESSCPSQIECCGGVHGCERPADHKGWHVSGPHRWADSRRPQHA